MIKSKDILLFQYFLLCGIETLERNTSNKDTYTAINFRQNMIRSQIRINLQITVSHPYSLIDNVIYNYEILKRYTFSN